MRYNLNINHRFQIISFLIIVFSSVLLVFHVESQTFNKMEIRIIIPNNNPQYLKVVKPLEASLKKNLSISNIKVINLSLTRSFQRENFNNKELVVLVGSKSLDFYIKSDFKSPYVTSLITQSAFNHIFSKARNKNGFVGGVSIDQHPKRFFSLAKSVVPNLKNAALIMGPAMIKKKSYILKSLESFNLDLEVVEILLKGNPVKKLRKAYETNQALIIFPDNKKFNSNLSRWVLTLSYKYKIPVISYSKKYANAGALASIFSSPEQISYQTAEIALSFLNNSNTPPRTLLYPKYFEIEINQSVSNTLGLQLPSKSQLLKQLGN